MSYATHETSLGIFKAIWGGSYGDKYFQDISDAFDCGLNLADGFKRFPIAQSVLLTDPKYTNQLRQRSASVGEDLNGKSIVYFQFEVTNNVYAYGLLIKPSSEAQKLMQVQK